MTATLLWALLGVAFVGLIAAVIVRLDAAALSHPVRLRLMAWGVPLSAALALFYASGVYCRTGRPAEWTFAGR